MKNAVTFLALAALYAMVPTIVRGATFDDFNDNIVDPTKWVIDRVSGPPGIRFVEQSGRLELLNTSNDVNQSVVVRDSSLALTYDKSWRVTANVSMLLDVDLDPSARIGLIIASPLSQVTGIFLKADSSSRRLQGYDGASFGPDFWTRPAFELSDHGQAMISYDAHYHLVTLEFSNGDEPPVAYGTLGIDGLAVGTLGTENWQMSNSDPFMLSLMGTTAGTRVSADQVWIDDVEVYVERVGDLNADDAVDAADAGIMFANWTGDSVSVPEPTGLPLSWLGMSFVLATSPNRQSRRSRRTA